MNTEIDSFTIGGTRAGVSMPGPRLQRMLGTRIEIDIDAHVLRVPTPNGMVIARPGDRIILYKGDVLEVEKRDQ